MEDLIRVRVADSGHELLVAQEVLELARMSSDAGPPLVQVQGRVVGVGAHFIGTGSGRLPVDAARQEVDLAHLSWVAVAELGRGVWTGNP